MFSKTCEYAIRAMLFVAQRSRGGEKAGIREIAAGIDSPEHFIAKILQELVRHGLILSAKGPNGGFYLNEHTAGNTLADVVTAIDGDKIFAGCGLGLHQCSETHPCPIHHEFKQIRKNIFDMLRKARVDQFNEQLEQHLAFLKR